MAVPESIRKVARPINTVVEDNKREGPKRYAVRERAYVKYVKGGNPQPRNGRIIGHIYEGVFVPVEEKKMNPIPEMLSFGASALVKSVTRDIYLDLLDLYPIKDVMSIILSAASLS